MKIGDRVRITNVQECEYGWNDEMLRLEGTISIVESIVNGRIGLRYNEYIWSDNCLEPVCELNPFTDEE